MVKHYGLVIVGHNIFVLIEIELKSIFQRQSTIKSLLVTDEHLTILADAIFVGSFEDHVRVMLLSTENDPYLLIDHPVVERTIQNELITLLSRHKDTWTMSEISLPRPMVLVVDALVVLRALTLPKSLEEVAFVPSAIGVLQNSLSVDYIVEELA